MNDFAAGSLSAHVYSLHYSAGQASSVANHIHRLSASCDVTQVHAQEILDTADKLEAAARCLRETAATALPVRYLQAAE